MTAATIPDSIWSKELLRLLLPELPRDDLPTEAMRLDLHHWITRSCGGARVRRAATSTVAIPCGPTIA